MFDQKARVIARFASGDHMAATVGGPGLVELAGLEIDVQLEADQLTWSVANSTGEPVALDALRVEWDAPAGADVRMFCNGYQSWSPTGTRRLGVDADPSQHPDALAFVRAVHHANPGALPGATLRSELVTVADLGLGDRSDGLVCAGFDGGARHSGTVHLRRSANGEVVFAAEAWLGGATLRPGERRELHGVRVTGGDDPAQLLDDWATRAGANERARITSPHRIGWCSWYYYFHQVTEAAVLRNLACAGDWPFDVFQVDDGFQHEVGDWLTTNDRFPTGVDAMASAIAARGVTPGIWLAPFLAAPASDLAAAHPEWFARERDRDAPLMGMFHPEWGGVMWELDTTRDDVRAHLRDTARRLVEAGYRYLKLDFTFSAGVPGRYAEPTKTPAERVRAGYDAVREGAGDDTFILACGCPLGAVVGVADAMRIGPDVAPSWGLRPESHPLPGYEAAAASTRNAWASTLARSFMHRRLWANDPDCVMLRSTDTQLTPDEVRAWAYAVGLSGGLALVSDDLASLGPDARRLLDEVVALGKAADAAAVHGPAPRCDDLLDAGIPTRLTAAGQRLRCDPDDPKPRLEAIAAR